MRACRGVRARVSSASACALAAWVFVAAQGTFAETLDDAWSAAASSDLSLKAARSRVEAAEGRLAAARAERLPMLSVGMSALHLYENPAFSFSAIGIAGELPLFSTSSVTMADARVTQPLYTGGAITSGISAASADLDARQGDTKSLHQQLKLAVAERYLDVLRAQSALKVAEANVGSLTAHVADTEDMYRTGAVPRNDFLAAAVSLADAEQRRLQARNALEVARAAYNRALGRPLEDPVTLDETMPAIDAQLAAGPVEALMALALEQRGESAALEGAAVALGAQANAARAVARPQLALTAGYLSLENSFLNVQSAWAVGLGVRWQLFDAGRSRARADALALESRSFAQQREDTESVIVLQVREAWLLAGDAAERVEVARSAVGQAEENLRVVRDRYVNGEGTNTEVLTAETLRSASLSNYDNARYDLALERYRLARAVGQL
jgi:outer membrane protein